MLDPETRGKIGSWMVDAIASVAAEMEAYAPYVSMYPPKIGQIDWHTDGMKDADWVRFLVKVEEGGLYASGSTQQAASS